MRVRAPHPRGRATGVTRLDGRVLTAARLARQAPVARLRRPRAAQPSGNERLLARLSGRRPLAPAAGVGLGGAERCRERGRAVGRPHPAGAAGRAGRDGTRSSPGWAPTSSPRTSILEAALASLRGGSPQRQIGEALLDQPLVAGIGNIFKSEGCFAARVDPWTPLGDLDDRRLGGGPARHPRPDGGRGPQRPPTADRLQARRAGPAGPVALRSAPRARETPTARPTGAPAARPEANSRTVSGLSR